MASIDERMNRRCPPGVVKTSIFPESAHRRSVSGSTPRIRLASPSVSQSPRSRVVVFEIPQIQAKLSPIALALGQVLRPTIAANEERQDDGGQQAATEAGVAVRLASIGQDDAGARACRRLWRGAAQSGRVETGTGR